MNAFRFTRSTLPIHLRKFVAGAVLQGHLLLLGGSLACLLSVSAHAQSTFGSIRGAATDASGASIPDTTLTLHSVDENTDRTAASDPSGAFLFENIKPGAYSLRATHSGFSTANLTGITLAARQDLRLSVALTVASESTTVEIVATSDQLNTENAAIGDSKDNALITQLPLNNRATTTSPLGALSLSANVQQDSQGNIAVGGASSSMVNFSVDGISTANVRQNGALQDAYPSQEGIAAVKVTAFNNSAEFSQVGDVTFTTKSGSNRHHGSVFEYFQNAALDASPYGFSGKAPKNFNTFGGSFSGPVDLPFLYHGQDRTFFFADYEGNRRTLAVAQQFLVPGALERTGNLSGMLDAAGNPGPVIPQSRISPTAAALLQYYPLPNVTGNAGYNYEHFQSTPARTDGADLRVDQTINTKQSIYARFSRKNITADYANPLLPNDSDSVHNRSLLVAHTYTITPRLLNEFRFGFTNVTTSVAFPISGATALQQLSLTGVDISQHPLTNAFPTFNFNAGTNFTPIGRDKTGVTQSKTTQFSDNLTFTVGKHTLKGGIDIRRVRYFDIETFAGSDDFGSFTFQPTFVQNAAGNGNAFGDFLVGLPTTVFFAVSSPDVAGKGTQYSFFAQDEWQATSKLTINYGLRYQLLPAFTEDSGDLANFDPATNSIIVPDSLAANLVSQKLTGSNLAFLQSFNACSLQQKQLPCSDYKTASQAGLPQGLRQTYKKNFQPRLSLAYRPFNDTKTVLRGGFGIYTMTNLGPLSFNNSGNPTSNLHTYTNTLDAQGQPLIQFPNTAPANQGIQYGGGNLIQGVDPRYRDPQSTQYSLTLERQLTTNDMLRVSLVGMHSYRLNITEDLNQIPASRIPYNSASAGTAGVFVDSRAPYQNWNELYRSGNTGKSNYRALEVEASHRMSHGLYFNANYTLAENKADNQGDVPSGFAGEVNYGYPIADRFNIASAYGNVEGTRRQRLLASGIVQLPFGQGRRFVNGGGFVDRILGGWDLNTVALLETGPWLTPTISTSADQSNTNVQNRGALLRPDVVSTDFARGRSRDQYFNLAAFQPTPDGAGRFGNAGVGILEGPGTKTVSMGIAKSFRVTESSRIRFESSFTNIFNHTNFAPPATQIDNTGFGELQRATTAENAGNRTGQFALRYDF